MFPEYNPTQYSEDTSILHNNERQKKSLLNHQHILVVEVDADADGCANDNFRTLSSTVVARLCGSKHVIQHIIQHIIQHCSIYTYLSLQDIQ